MTLSENFVAPPIPARNGHNVSNGYHQPDPVVPRPRWDRDPQPGLAKRIAQAKRRRAKAIAKGRKLLSSRTLGMDVRVEARLRRAHALYSEVAVASMTIIRLELLD